LCAGIARAVAVEAPDSGSCLMSAVAAGLQVEGVHSNLWTHLLLLWGQHVVLGQPAEQELVKALHGCTGIAPAVAPAVEQCSQPQAQAVRHDAVAAPPVFVLE